MYFISRSWVDHPLVGKTYWMTYTYLETEATLKYAFTGDKNFERPNTPRSGALAPGRYFLMLNSTEQEMCPYIFKTYGIFKSISRINTPIKNLTARKIIFSAFSRDFMPSLVEQEKSFIISGPGSYRKDGQWRLRRAWAFSDTLLTETKH